MPGLVLRAAAKAYEPGTRATSAPGQQPPVRRRGIRASPGAGRGHRPPNPAAHSPARQGRRQVGPPDHTQPVAAPPRPRGRTVDNTAAPGSSDRAAGLQHRRRKFIFGAGGRRRRRRWCGGGGAASCKSSSTAAAGVIRGAKQAGSNWRRRAGLARGVGNKRFPI